MRNEENPYQAYTDGNVFSDNPLNLVVALYEGALDATNQAASALTAGDVLRRTKAINKGISILTELLVTLDHKRGGEISQNLKRLYSYMQVQLLTAHARQQSEPLAEVSRLLSTLLEAWRGAGVKESAVPDYSVPPTEYASAPGYASSPLAHTGAPVYGGYLDDGAISFSNTAYSF